MSNHPFTEAYILNQPKAAGLIGSHFASREDWRRIVNERNFNHNRNGLVRAILEFNPKLSPEAQKNLELLNRDDSLAVCTGQQPGLFGGPVLSLYKAASAIAVAKLMSQELDRPCVPIFWVHTQDHDLSEINRASFPSKTSSLETLHAAMLPEDEQMPNAGRVYSNDIAALLAALSEASSHFEASDHWLSVLGDSYRANRRPGEAFRDLFNTVFAEEGLLLFDPSGEAAVELANEVYQLAFGRQREIEQVLEQRNEQIIQSGFVPQVRLRPGSPLFFFHPEGQNGRRYRVEKSNDRWKLLGSDITLSDSKLRQTLKQPDHFSPSALLRPLLQDTIIPTVAYVGGPNEISYLSQSASIYPLFNTKMPLIFPRTSVLLVEPKAQRWLEELGLRAEDIPAEPSFLHRLSALSNLESKPSPVELQASLESSLRQMLNPLTELFSTVDHTLVASLHKSEAKMLYQLQTLTNRYENALARQNQVALNRLTQLQSIFYPESNAQERGYCLGYVLCRYGQGVKKRLLEVLDPLNQSTKTLVINP